MELILQDMEINFERADKGLGLSIAGGLGSTPYKNNDEGIFISRVTPNGPADIAGLRKDDKVLSVNQHSCVNIDHYEAVGVLKAAGNYINMKIQREVFVQKKVHISILSTIFLVITVFSVLPLFFFSSATVYMNKKYFRR